MLKTYKGILNMLEENRDKIFEALMVSPVKCSTPNYTVFLSTTEEYYVEIASLRKKIAEIEYVINNN